VERALITWDQPTSPEPGISATDEKLWRMADTSVTPLWPCTINTIRLGRRRQRWLFTMNRQFSTTRFTRRKRQGSAAVPKTSQLDWFTCNH
jgi:hypothetical protein